MTEPAGPLGWTPPDGMLPEVRKSWAAFYRAARARYGITPAQYRALYLAQLGRCYICRKAKGIHPDDPRGHGTRRLGIDHNHAIGDGRQDAVRGLLCTGGDRTCNRIIGWLDRPSLTRAVDLMETMPAQAVLARMREVHSDRELMGMVIQ